MQMRNIRPQNPLVFVGSILQTRNEQSLFYLPQQHNTQYYQTQISTKKYYLPTQPALSTQKKTYYNKRKGAVNKCGRSFLPSGMNKHLNACNKKKTLYVFYFSSRYFYV